ncbi:hypothetical protein KO507_19805, partial [Gilvimarinus agarilyticus]|uniref:beta strand repeat-containing protein n=1 Tax=Gilvimarinus sp. 2_MG-2023 TaxID=3062666 RepID=UPI001C092DFD
TFTLNSGNFSQIVATLPTFLADDFVINGGTFTRAIGGDGTGSPLQLTDIYGLQGLDTTLSLNAVLISDIDASGTASWNGGEGFDPIGDYSNYYTGTFDGAGHVIDGLTIQRPSQDGVALFGRTSGTSRIEGVGLTGASIEGDGKAGGLVGFNEGTISQSYATGSVTGSTYVGGLVGVNWGAGVISESYATGSVTDDEYVGGLVGLNAGTISQSYATGSATGDTDVGGLVGSNMGDISQSYATGSVTGHFTGGLVGRNAGTISQSYATGSVTGSTYVGGLVGYNNNAGVVSSSYWDGFTTGMGAVGVGFNSGSFTATQVNGNWGSDTAYNASTYTDLDFTNDWFIAEGSSRPMLRAFLDGGNISNLYQLQGMAADLGGTYTLLNDIDASATADSVAQGDLGNYSDIWGGRGFAPVGTSGAEFSGSLDGEGFVIDGLTIARPDQDDVGLFGRIESAASTIENIGLTNVNVEGQGYVGGIAGGAVGNSGNFILSNVFAEGSVTGSANSIGGLVGFLGGASGGNGSIVQSYAAVDVTSAGSKVGGLVGQSDGSIQTSYATGSVEGLQSVGGLVGEMFGSITDSYATGAVNATFDSAGGLVGQVLFGSVSRSWASGAVTATSGFTGGLIGRSSGPVLLTNSYWDSHTTGQLTSSGGGTALNGNWATLVPGDSAYSADNYTGFDFTNTWFIAEGSSRPMLRAHLSGGGEIHNLYDLQGMAADLAGSYTLMTDIDASA